MKIHLCAGDIYLKGYVNCDIIGKIVRGNGYGHRTTLADYYRGRNMGAKKPTFVDRRMNILKFPWNFKSSSAEEIVMIQGIEHFTLPQAKQIVAEVHRVLKVGGKFLVDFPDIEETVKQYIQTDPNFCMRFVYCNHKNQYSIHHWGYTRQTFPELLGAGWKIKFKDIVQHAYPVIGCEATKI